MVNEVIIASSSASPSQHLLSGASGLVAIILSSFFGGLFAGWWSNYFETKRRIHDKRHDKYYEHRNTIVQIEQELIPLRLNIFRDLASITDAIENTNDQNIRFILRFYKLFLSTGLGLKLLSLNLINKYAELYSAIESFNSDIDYVSGMISSIRDDEKEGRIDQSKVDSYRIFLPKLKDGAEQIDQKSLEILAMGKLAIGKDDRKIKEKYIKDGEEIKHSFGKKLLAQKYKSIKNEEDGSLHKDEKQPKFVSPYLDLKRVLITKQPTQ